MTLSSAICDWYFHRVSTLKVSLEGRLSVTLSAGSCAPSDGVTTGPTIDLVLREKNMCPKTYAGTISTPISSPNAYVTLPMQPSQRAGLVLIDTEDAEFTLRITRADDTTLVIPLQGLFVYEVPSGNLVKLIEVQGSGPILWHASGPLA